MALTPACAWAQGEPQGDPAGRTTPKEGPAPSTPPKEGVSADAAGTTIEVQKEPKGNAARPQSGDEAYKLKITQLRRRVNDLKEKIFQSKVRLNMLKSSILDTGIAGAEIQLLHRNEMGSSFKLEKVSYSLDGRPIYQDVDREGSLDEREEIPILDGPIPPGNHTVSVVMVYRGHGYGIFSYLEGYVFKLRSSETFYAEEGKRTVIRIVGYEKGGLTTDLQERPSIRYDKQVQDLQAQATTARLNEGAEKKP
ncbi:MAG: dihydrolipoamide acetyltransferase [Bradymonadia bacterium]